MRAKEREYFDKIADIFDTHYNVYLRATGKLRVKRRIDLFSRHCQLKSGLKILEIGAGTGEYSKRLLEYDCSLFCTDISYNMLNKAVKKIQKQNNLYFFISDIEQAPLKDNVFDVVVGNSILHHLDIEKALNQIFRLLKKDGRFAFSEPNMFNPQVFMQKNIKFFKRISGDSPREVAFVRWRIKEFFRKTGFRSVCVEPFDFLHHYTPTSLVKIVSKIGLVLEKIPLIKEIAGSLFITGIK